MFVCVCECECVCECVCVSVCVCVLWCRCVCVTYRLSELNKRETDILDKIALFWSREKHNLCVVKTLLRL